MQYVLHILDTFHLIQRTYYTRQNRPDKLADEWLCYLYLLIPRVPYWCQTLFVHLVLQAAPKTEKHFPRKLTWNWLRSGTDLLGFGSADALSFPTSAAVHFLGRPDEFGRVKSSVLRGHPRLHAPQECPTCSDFWFTGFFALKSGHRSAIHLHEHVCLVTLFLRWSSR